MARNTICDDCNKILELPETVKIDMYYRNPDGFDMCFVCFEKHWKPLKKKFHLNQPRKPQTHTHFVET